MSKDEFPRIFRPDPNGEEVPEPTKEQAHELRVYRGPVPETEAFGEIDPSIMKTRTGVLGALIATVFNKRERPEKDSA